MASEPPGPDSGEAGETGSGPVVLVVDVANVMGSRPDGWWRDRAGAASRLMASLAPLAGQVVRGPGRPKEGGPERAGREQAGPEPVGLSRIVAVVEGQAKRASAPDGIDVVLAPRDGDSAIVAAARDIAGDGGVPLVVTADRGLRERLPPEAQVAGPAWLLALL